MSCSSQSDGYSETYSLFSHPMTRASSAATEYSGLLVVPLEKAQTPSKRDMNGPRRMLRTTRVQAVGETHNRLDPVLESVEVDVQPRGAYSSIPTDHTPNYAPVQRNKSTKDLIRRFESLERDSSASQTPKTSGKNKITVSGENTRGAGMQKLRNRSPLRRSFGNLLAIFGKKPKAAVNVRDGLLSTPYQSAAADVVTIPGKNLEDLSASLLSGSLLYLSPPTLFDGISLPVWTDCTTTLFPTRILATWHTSQGNPHSHVIQLNSCIDVHSLAMEELDLNEIALLPTRELRVFELIFRDGPTEKFVAASVQERAGWVSAIWDAILGNQERKKAGSIISAELPEDYIDSLVRQEMTYPQSFTVPLVSQASSYDTERDLPPTPMPSPPSHKPDIPSPRPSRPQSSFLCTSTTSSPRSASILDLDKRSVVTSRLNQIERTKSITSSRRRCRDNNGTLESRLGKQASIRSTGGDSLIELYEDDSTLATAWNSHSTWTAPKPAPIPEASPRAVERPNGAQEIDSPTSTYTTAHPDARLGPLMELLQDQATKHYYHTNDLGDQISLLHSEIHGMFDELKVVVGEQPTVGVDKFVESVEKSMIGFEHRLKENKGSEGVVVGVKERLDSIYAEIRSYREAERADVEHISQAVLEKLDTLNLGMKDQDAIPQIIAQELEMLRLAISTRDETREVVLENLKSSANVEGPNSVLPELSEVNAKLDILLQEWEAGMAGAHKDTEAAVTDNPELKEITELLKVDQSQRNAQLEQQTDSVRYLNELNTWLETFVSDGTSKIDAVASGVEQLRRELAPVGEEAGEGPRQTGGLLANIELLLTESKARDQSLAVLHASVNGLFAAVNDRMTDGGNAMTTEAVAGLLDQQRRHQEQMLRTLASDLSNDIKGERLRFIEAMKEATAINVQIHVEEFKKQLTREVLLMTQEVGRLQKERQALEQQIADLFTFYAKQKNLTAGMMGVAPVLGGPMR